MPSELDFSLSNRCNLQCVMCNGDLSSTIRERRERRPPLAEAYDDRFFDELAEFLPGVRRAQFKGGEPFLAPATTRVWDLMLDLGAVPAESVVTTNGTIWTERVERYLRELRMDVAVSVDGIAPATLETIRVGARFDALWRNIDRFQTVTWDVGTHLTLNFCLLQQNWRELPAFLRECDRRGATAHVIVVDQPRQHTLLDLPAAERDAIILELQRIDARAEPPLGPSRSAWDGALTELRQDGRASTEVAAPIRRSPPIGEDRRIRTLNETTGHDPLVLQVERTELTRICTRPRWASALAPDSWLGRRVIEIPDLISAAGGGIERIESSQETDGSIRSTIRLSSVELLGTSVLEAHFLPSPDGGDPVDHVALAPVATTADP